MQCCNIIIATTSQITRAVFGKYQFEILLEEMLFILQVNVFVITLNYAYANGSSLD